MINVVRSEIPDVLRIEHQVFFDARGFFYESFNAKEFREEAAVAVEFVQDNYSRSTKGVLRGLHYQLPPNAQGKLIRVVRGRIFDVAVDLRRTSPFFGKWVGFELGEDDAAEIWIPPGFAHGFQAISEVADVFYKATAYYAPDQQRCLAWDDRELAINWPDHAPGLSEKDRAGSLLKDAESFE